MAKEINLLPKKSTGILQQERTILILRISAIFSVVFVASVMLGIFILGRNNSVDAITAQQNAMDAKIQLLKPKIQKEIALVNRVNQIQALLKKRSSIVKKASEIQSLIPSGVSIKQFTLTTQSFSLSLSSASLSTLSTCVDTFTSTLKQKIIFSSVTIDSVAVDTKTGLYGVSIKGNLL